MREAVAITATESRDRTVRMTSFYKKKCPASRNVMGPDVGLSLISTVYGLKSTGAAIELFETA